MRDFRICFVAQISLVFLAETDLKIALRCLKIRKYFILLYPAYYRKSIKRFKKRNNKESAKNIYYEYTNPRKPCPDNR